MASVKLISETALYGNIGKLMTDTLAVGTVWIASVAHLSVAAEIGISQLGSIVVVPVPRSIAVHRPGICRVDVQIEIVTEDAVLIHFTVRTVQVVLQLVVVARKIAFGKLVDIQHIVAAQQVVYRLELARLRKARPYSRRQTQMTVKLLVQCGVERGLQQVAAALFHHIYGSTVTGTQVIGIGQIKVVPVYLGEIGTSATP